MSDDPIRDDVAAEIDELKRRTAELGAWLVEYDRRRAKARPSGLAAGDTGGKKLADLVEKSYEPPKEATKRRPKQRGAPQAVADAAALILRQQGKPMTRGELALAIEAGGMPINAADKQRYVGTALWRDKLERFENIEGQGYTLKELIALQRVGI